MDLYEKIQQKQNELDTSVRALRNTGNSKAETERDYKIALTQEALKMKDNKNPVTFISLIIHGVRHIAELRFKRDVADVIYQANLESINSIKLQLRILENQLDREWRTSQKIGEWNK